MTLFLVVGERSGGVYSPSWSPDGQHIVYERDGRPGFRIVEVDVRSGNERTLHRPDPKLNGFDVVWGKPGIAYTNDSGIVLLNPATRRCPLMARGHFGGQFHGELAWSPSGVLAAVQPTQIVLVAATGRVLGKLPLPSAMGQPWEIGWTGDGTQINAWSWRGGRVWLWVGTVSTNHWRRFRVPDLSRR